MHVHDIAIFLWIAASVAGAAAVVCRGRCEPGSPAARVGGACGLVFGVACVVLGVVGGIVGLDVGALP